MLSVHGYVFKNAPNAFLFPSIHKLIIYDFFMFVGYGKKQKVKIIGHLFKLDKRG